MKNDMKDDKLETETKERGTSELTRLLGCNMLNDDCLAVMENMPDNCIDLLITDPPYGIEFQSNHRKEKWDKIEGDDSLLWLPEFSAKAKRILKPEAHAYIFCSHHNVEAFKKIICDFLPYKNKLIWKKNNWGVGDLAGDYAPQYEEILFFSNGNKDLNGKRDSNILEFARTGNHLHPTQKPENLIRYLIQKSTEKGDIIFDPFMGSGTACTAAHKEQREFLGIELSEQHFETARKRYRQAKAQATLGLN